MREINAIAFDLDHTLYDRNATWSALTERFQDEFQVSCSSAQLCRKLQDADYISTYEESSWRGMLEKLQHWEILSPEITFIQFDTFIRRYFPEAIVPYDDTYFILDWCHINGLQPSLITNGHTGLQERKLSCMHLDQAFEVCIICNLDNGVPCKPAREPFMQLSTLLNLSPEHILYVGDNPINDIAGAAGCGMQTAWLNIMHNWKVSVPKPTFEINRLSELPALILGR